MLKHWMEQGYARSFACSVETQDGDVLLWATEDSSEAASLLDKASDLARNPRTSEETMGCYQRAMG